MWWKRRKIQGLLAASLYEPLTPDEQAELDRALAASPEFQAEANALRRLVNTTPSHSPDFDADLLPLLHQRLANESGQRPCPVSRRRVVWASACVFALVLGGALLIWTNQATAPGGSPNATLRSGEEPTLLAQAIVEADFLVEDRKPYQAYELLTKGVEAQPDDPLVAQAQLRIADLDFEFGRYAKSLEAHNLLVKPPYVNALDESEKHRIVWRRDLLTEAAARDFKPLYAVDAAMGNRGNELAGLELVITNYPQLHVADLAAENMGHLLADTAAHPDVKTAYLEGLKAARAQCTEPNAVALLDLKIGDRYRDDFKDIPAAETHYRKAFENPVLAKRAGDALGSLSSDR